MNPLMMFGVALIAGGLAAVVAGRRREAALAELRDALETADGEFVEDRFTDWLAQPLPLRLLEPAGRWVAARAASLLPRNHLDRLRTKLVRAGVAARFAPEEFLAVQVVAVVGGLVLAALLLTNSGIEGSRRIAAAVLGVVIGAIAPNAWLSRNREERVRSIQRDLPDVLDLMAISVEAGVGLEGALEVAVRNFDTPLARELSHTLREMRLGLTRREALQNLRNRVDVPELSGFVMSLLQADALGMPLGRVLRTQAHDLRDRRRQTARETAAKLPVKMLFPMVVFILPSIFVIALGPAALDLIRALG